MGKEKERVELRSIDEDEIGENPAIVRLHEDNRAEEVVELPTLKVGVKKGVEARPDLEEREEMRGKSKKPTGAQLVEREEYTPEMRWEESAEEKRRVPWGWVAVVCMAFAGGLIWSLIQVGKGKGTREVMEEEVQGVLEREAEEEEAAARTIDALERSTRNFFDARSVDELLESVRHPERVRPFLEKYYGEGGVAPRRVRSVENMDPLTIDLMANFWLVRLLFEDGETADVVTEVVPRDGVRVDWETYVCYQPMDWNDFAMGRPEGFSGDFRVYVEADHYYSHEFSDSERYASFRLTALRGDETLYGYVERSSPLFGKMEEELAKSEGGVTPMLLRLKIPEGVKSDRGVVIEEMIMARWLYLENPMEDGR